MGDGIQVQIKNESIWLASTIILRSEPSCISSWSCISEFVRHCLFKQATYNRSILMLTSEKQSAISVEFLSKRLGMVHSCCLHRDRNKIRIGSTNLAEYHIICSFVLTCKSTVQHRSSASKKQKTGSGWINIFLRPVDGLRRLVRLVWRMPWRIHQKISSNTVTNVIHLLFILDKLGHYNSGGSSSCFFTE